MSYLSGKRLASIIFVLLCIFISLALSNFVYLYSFMKSDKKSELPIIQARMATPLEK